MAETVANTVNALNTESTRGTTGKSRDVEPRLECNPNHKVPPQEEKKVDTVVENNIYCEFRSKDVVESNKIFPLDPIRDSSREYVLIL